MLHRQFLESIFISGVASVVCVDFAEVVSHLLDPTVKRALKRKNTDGGSLVVTSSQVSATLPTSSLTAPLPGVEIAKDANDKRLKKEKEAKLAEKQMVKRLIRILLLVGIAYLFLHYVVK